MNLRFILLSIAFLIIAINYTSGQCSELENLTSGIPNVEYGRAVATDGTQVVVGSKDYTYGVSSGAVYLYQPNGSNWSETKLIASDGVSNADFGASVGISNNRIIVGAPGDGPGGVQSGSAYIYDWDGANWIETKLTASDGTSFDNFGSSVAISGDRIVVAAIGDDDFGSDSGSIYTFVWDGNSWIETKLLPSDGGSFDGFGIDVDISGDRIVVGSNYDDDNGTNSGSIYLFDWVVNTWVETKITASEGSGADYYGSSVGVSGDIIAVGAIGDDDNGNGSGSMYVYQWNGSNWNETKIIASDGSAGDNFGTSISCFGNRIVIDSHRDDDNGLDSGSAYLFELIGNNWNETKLTASDGDIGDNFGISVAIANNLIVVGAYQDDDNGLETGSSYIFELSGSNWQETKIIPTDGFSFDRFGTSVSIFDNRIVVGAVDDATNGENSGAIFINDWDGSNWTSTKLIASDGDVNDRFGTSVSVGLDRIVVGSPGDDDNGTSSGSAYIYDWDGSSWQETKLTNSDGSSFDNFGESLSIDGDRIAIGAFGEGANGSYSGSVYVYDWNGATWSETKLIANDGIVYDFMGRSVSVSGDIIVAGAYSNDDNGQDAGSIYVFDYNGSSWGQTLILPSDGTNGDNFGKGVTVSGNRIVAGADKDDDNGADAGSIYIYDWDGSTWVETKLLASDGAAFDNFGASVSNSGNRIAVGAANNDDNGSNSGSIYVYDWNGTAWIESNYLSTYSQFGSASASAVAISDDYVVMGIPNVNVTTVFDCNTGCADPPIAICKDVTVDLSSGGNASITPEDVNNGSSDDCSVPSFALSQSTFTCSDVGITQVTFTAIDDEGNTSTCMANVTVNDITQPTVLCQNYTVTLNGNGMAIVNPSDIDNGSADACGIGSMTLSQTTFTCDDLGINSVILTVTDLSGNQNSCTALVTVVNTQQLVQCQNHTAFLDTNGNAFITVADINDGSYNLCGIASMTLSQTAFTCADVGSNNVILTVTDVGGNDSTCAAIVNVVNSSPPIAQCQDYTAYLDSSGSASISVADIDNGSSSECGIASMTLSQTMFGCDDIGNNTVVLTVTDVTGNQSTCSAIVNVIGNSALTAQCQDITAYLGNTGNAIISASDIDDGSSSECGNITMMTLSQSFFTCNNLGDNTVILTVSDAFGNTSTCSSIVTIENPQQTTACQNHTAFLDANGNASINVSDINNGSYNLCGISSMTLSQSNFTCNDIGSNNVILTITDTDGNESTCNSVVNVLNDTPPVANCNDLTLFLGSSGNTVVSALQVNNNSTDNCGISGMLLSQTTFTCADVGTQNVILTVTNTSGISSSCNSTITIVDNMSACCPTNLDESSNPITNDYYQAAQTITSTGNVPNNGNVTFGASTICLDGGFEVEVGATFEAIIDPCSN